MVLYLARTNGIRISYPFNNTALPSTLVSAQVNGSHLRLHHTYRGWQVGKVVPHIGFHTNTAQRTILVPIANVEVPNQPQFTDLFILLLSPSQLPLFRSFLRSCILSALEKKFFRLKKSFSMQFKVVKMLLLFSAAFLSSTNSNSLC